MKKSKRSLSLLMMLVILLGTFAVIGCISAGAAYALSAPKITGLSSSDDGVKITWGAVSGAAKYRVYYKGSKGWTKMGETTSTSFVDRDVSWGGTYTYTVRCVNAAGNAFTSDYDSIGRKHTHYLASPQIDTFSDSSAGVSVAWTPVENAYGYRVYRKSGNTWKRIGEAIGAVFTDSDVRYGSSYTYTVRCINAAGTFVSGFNSAGRAHTYYTQTPKISTIDSTGDGAVIRWNTVEGADKYRVYYKGKNGWVKMADTKDTAYLDTDVKWGGSYTYTVRCINAAGDRFLSSYHAAGWKHTHYLDTPQITDFESVGAGVRIYWEPVADAKKYRVYYKGSSGWIKMGETAGTYFIDDDVKIGSTYRYTVRCLDDDAAAFTSDFDAAGWTYTYSPQLATPIISDYAAVSNGLELRWNPVYGADLYRVYYRGSSGWVKMADVRGTSYVDTDVRYGKTYRYTIRCLSSRSRGFASSYSSTGTYARYIEPPAITGFEQVSDGVRVRFKHVELAGYYYLYRKENGGSWHKVAGTSGEDDYLVDTTAQKGRTYTYTMRAGVSNEGDVVSYFNTAGWTYTYQ